MRSPVCPAFPSFLKTQAASREGPRHLTTTVLFLSLAAHVVVLDDLRHWFTTKISFTSSVFPQLQNQALLDGDVATEAWSGIERSYEIAEFQHLCVLWSK